MRITEIMKLEHDLIEQMLEVLQSICIMLQDGQPVDPVHLSQINDFIQNYGDRCHHGKEEDLLFRALERTGFEKNNSLLASYLVDHRLSRIYLRNMINGIETIGNNRSLAIQTFCDNALEYVALFNLHIRKENTILFPMADEHLPVGDQSLLEQQALRFDRDRIGKSDIEKYEQLPLILSDIYGKAIATTKGDD
jgi:hemerythrin-like domain-containing protein